MSSLPSSSEITGEECSIEFVAAIKPTVQSTHAVIPKSDSNLLSAFSIQQSPVLSNLHLQPSLDVQQYLVLAALSRDVVVQPTQLCLQVVDDCLQLA